MRNWGDSKGAGGGASPPVYMLKEALVVLDIKRCAIKGTKIAVLI